MFYLLDCIRKFRRHESYCISDLHGKYELYLQPMVYVAIYYGLRKSEVLGLRWQDIDFVRDTITIQHTVVKNKTIIEKDSTKTSNSRAVMALIDDVKNVLLGLREKEQGYSSFVSGGITFSNSGSIFNSSSISFLLVFY